MIGTNFDGTTGIANLGHGIIINDSPNNTIGGTAANAGNVISDNDDGGILITGSSSTGNRMQGNFIGTDVTGIAPLANASYGVMITSSASNNTVGGMATGAGNTIAYNLADGVFVESGTGNAIRANTIFENTGLGIDLAPDGVGTGSGANSDQTAPEIKLLMSSGANFTVMASAAAGDNFDFFRVNNAAAPVVNTDPTAYGEGFLYLGTCPDNGACTGPHISAVNDADPSSGTVQATLLSSGLSIDDTVSATATDASGNTSEFGAFLYTTDVTIDWFTATAQGDAVMLSWQTVQELTIRGFHLHRATSPQGPFTQVTAERIHIALPSITGNVYTHTDQPPPLPSDASNYYYQLEVIGQHDTRTFEGPIPVD